MEDETGEVERLRCPEYIRYRQGNVGSGWEEAGAADQRDLSYGTKLVIFLKNPIIHVMYAYVRVALGSAWTN